MSSSPILHIMMKAAEKAAAGLVRDFGELEKLQISKKGFSGFVTSADRNAEGKIIYELSKSRPEYSFLCEESGVIENENKEFVWIVDPIDGTSNFMRGIPYFAINIALMNNDSVMAGLTLDPMRGDCFKAEAGSGAFIGNRNRARVTIREQLEEAVIAAKIPLGDMIRFEKTRSIIRRTGSVALDLAYLASGKFDAVIAENVGLWDIASGIVLVKEAGGFIEYSKNNNGRYNVVAASSSKLLSLLYK